MLVEDRSQDLADHTPFNVPTEFAEYRFDRHGVNIERFYGADTTDDFENLGLRRNASEESLCTQISTDGDISMVSSGYLPPRSDSPAHVVYGAGDWIARSGYFVAAPLPLTSPLRGATCRYTDAHSEISDHALFSMSVSDLSMFSDDATESPGRTSSPTKTFNQLIDTSALRKAALVEDLMNHVFILINACGNALLRQRQDGHGDQSSTRNTGVRSDTSASTSTARSAGKRKAGLPNSENDRSGDGQDGSQKKSRAAKSIDLFTIKRFACPFMQHNPHRYHRERSCAMPGFPTVPRVK